MNIKMKVKNNKNLKNKIELENILVSKNPHSFKPENINIQTININKRKNYINEEKKFWSSKNLKKNIYLNNSAINYNINNKKYYRNEEQISFFESSETERSPSPINSLTSSTHLIYKKTKKKQKRYQKKKIAKYHNKKYYNSLNNISFNSNINNSIFLASSSSSSSSSSDNDYDYSESSDISFRSRDNKRKRFYEEMMIEENDSDYLKKSEVGIISSEEEDNNNSLDISNSIEENFNNEIERILIDIYNKNITLVSSENYNEINKNNYQIVDTQKQIKKFLKRENFKINLLVLKSLSNKIKELVGKYKEKVFEIKEIKYLYNIMQKINNQQIHFNNSVESNVATNSNSNSLNDSNNDEENLFNLQDEIVSKAPSILLRELIHIKKTLKLSSKEIETIFKYPFSLLNEKGKKIKFSVELMQNEEFYKTLLNDEILSSLLRQIKGIFNQSNEIKIAKIIEELE